MFRVINLLTMGFIMFHHLSAQTKSSNSGIFIKSKKTINTYNILSWYDLLPGTYISKNCNSNSTYYWNSNGQGIGDGMAQMSLTEYKNGNIVSQFSTADDSFEFIEGCLQINDGTKLIITSPKSFKTIYKNRNSCSWYRRYNN